MTSPAKTRLPRCMKGEVTRRRIGGSADSFSGLLSFRAMSKKPRGERRGRQAEQARRNRIDVEYGRRAADRRDCEKHKRGNQQKNTSQMSGAHPMLTVATLTTPVRTTSQVIKRSARIPTEFDCQRETRVPVSVSGASDISTVASRLTSIVTCPSSARQTLG